MIKLDIAELRMLVKLKHDIELGNIQAALGRVFNMMKVFDKLSIIKRQEV